MKIKFNLNDSLSLNKTIEIRSIATVVTAIFNENNEIYPRVFINECLYKL